MASGVIAVVVVACANGSDANGDTFGGGDAGGGGFDEDSGYVDPGAEDSGYVDPTLDSGGGGSTTDSGGGTADAGGGKDAGGGNTCATALAKLAFDFESGDQGFTHGISDGVNPMGGAPAWPYDSWTRGTATTGTACHAGSCFGVELGKNYAQCERGYLLSPTIDLSACTGQSVSLTFFHAYQFWTGMYGGVTYADGGVVQVSGDNGATWQTLSGTGTVRINPNMGASYSCYDSNMFGVDFESGYTTAAGVSTAKVTQKLPAAVVTSKMRVRFSFASGVSSQTTTADTSRTLPTGFGWRIDDVGFLPQ